MNYSNPNELLDRTEVAAEFGTPKRWLEIALLRGEGPRITPHRPAGLLPPRRDSPLDRRTDRRRPHRPTREGTVMTKGFYPHRDDNLQAILLDPTLTVVQKLAEIAILICHVNRAHETAWMAMAMAMIAAEIGCSPDTVQRAKKARLA